MEVRLDFRPEADIHNKDHQHRYLQLHRER